MSLTPEERANIVEQAMKWNFAGLLVWEMPELEHTFGQNDLERVRGFEKLLNELRKEVREVLQHLSDEDLTQIQAELADACRVSERNKSSLLANKVNKLRDALPPPMAYGFGHPKLVARFEHWARMPKLSLAEVSLISLGADPSQMTWEKIQQLRKRRDDGRAIWAAQSELLDQFEIFSRCFRPVGYSIPPAPIRQIKEWIDDLGIEVHPQFYAGLEQRDASRTVETTQHDHKSLLAQERDTLLKIIAAMAVRGYKFDPDARRNPATADIQSDLDHLGLSLDPKTLLKWIREACDLIPKG